jgi:hypothetical protein
MKRMIVSSICAGAMVIAALSVTSVTKAVTYDTGQRMFGQAEVEPAFDLSNGDVIYLLTPLKAPLPSKANGAAVAPMYLPVYPMSSTVTTNDLNCQPTNCDHLNVLPFPDSDYGVLPGSDRACTDFNGGNPCSPVKGHNHLVGIASTKGDFNVAWHVKLVVFTPAGFTDGSINTMVTTLSQVNALVSKGDAFLADTPITFNCSRTSQQTYEIGTPIVISYP